MSFGAAAIVGSSDSDDMAVTVYAISATIPRGGGVVYIVGNARLAFHEYNAWYVAGYHS